MLTAVLAAHVKLPVSVQVLLAFEQLIAGLARVVQLFCNVCFLLVAYELGFGKETPRA